MDEDELIECEICRKRFCPECIDDDYKKTGWEVCIFCQPERDKIIDALLEALEQQRQETVYWKNRTTDYKKLYKELNEAVQESVTIN